MNRTEKDLSVEQIGDRYASLRLVRPKAERQMLESFQRFGQMAPVVVNESPDGVFELVDGFKRLRAGRQMEGLRTLRARVLDATGRAAKAAVLSLNWASRSVSDLEEGWVVHSLCVDDGLSQVEVSVMLGRDKSWVSRRLSLVQRLSEEVQEQIRLGLVTGTMGRELARLPRGNQRATMEAITGHQLCSREVAALVKILLDAEPADRMQLLQEPRQTLRSRGKWHQPQRDERLSDTGNRVLRGLVSLDQASRRVVAQVGLQGLAALAPADIKVLSKPLSKTLCISRQAILVLEEAMATSEEGDDGYPT